MQIARRTAVSNMREVWPNENQFSDWLVTEDGLALIAEDIGIQMEDPERECQPGDFSCDIVGHLQGDENHKVIIENQFNKTDHDHLGKLITYAAMHGAATAIWISELISDDHRKAIDWLNEATPESVSFYLAQIKAYQIGSSPVAPQLDVVCRPNLQFKVVSNRGSNAQSEIHVWRLSFWTDILNAIQRTNPPFRVPPPKTSEYANIRIARHFPMWLGLIPSKRLLQCGLWMQHEWKDDAFSQLVAQKAAIEDEIGAKLDWQRREGQKSAVVLLYGHIEPKDETKRQEVIDWFRKNAVAFYKAFHSRVSTMMPSSPHLANTSDTGNSDAPAPDDLDGVA